MCFMFCIFHMVVPLLGLTQCSPFITLILGSIGMNHVMSESCYKGTILKRNYVIKGQFYKGIIGNGHFPIVPL